MDISEEMVKSESSLEELLSCFDSNLLEGWCYYGTETKLTFIHTNMLTRKEDIRFSLDNNFSVKVSFSQRPEMTVNDDLTSVYDIINYMRKLQETILCKGTGIYYRSFAQNCTGQVPSNSTHSRQIPRCIWCRTLRKRLIMKNNTNITKITIQKAREIVEKYKKRFNQLVQKKRILNRELIRAKENAQRSEELLKSVISELPDSKKLSILEYLDESKLANKDISNHSLELFREQDLTILANHHQNEHSHSEIPGDFVDCEQDFVIKKKDMDYSEEEEKVEEEKEIVEGEEVYSELIEKDVSLETNPLEMPILEIKPDYSEEEEEERVEEEEEKKVVEEEVLHTYTLAQLLEKDVSLKKKPLKMPILEIKPLTSKRVAISVLQRDKSKSGTVNKYYSIIQLSDEEMYERIEKLKNEDVFLNASYKCESCVLTFKDENELDTHYNDLHLPKPLHIRCSICCMYIWHHRLYPHKAAHRLLYKCSTCGVAACVGNMLRHLSEHSVPIAELNNLKKTVMLLNPSIKYYENEYKCSECDECFEKSSLRHKHILKCHKEGFKCDTCGKSFPFRDSLNKHQQVHTPNLPKEKCPICHTMVRLDRVKAHAKIHSDREQFYCNLCNKKLFSKYTYEKHVKNPKLHAVRDVSMYTCDHCSKNFRYKSKLKDHINYNHMGRTDYKCPLCNKALATRRGVTRHIQCAHQGRKKNAGVKIMCEFCGKTFTNKKSLVEHELIHTGEKPLSCDICSRSFRQKACLYTHRRRVHNVPLREVVVHTGDDDHNNSGGLSH